MFVSSGCIVVKTFNGEPHILMVHAAGNWAIKLFGFPKGEVHENEDLKAAAIRETKEETGITPDILEYLGSVKKPNKEVHAYIALVKDGNLDGKKAVDIQKSEVDLAKFYPVDEAMRIAYVYQRPLFEKAKNYIERELK